jgi:cbb3-type cytochrome oxidase subunit 3
MNHQQPDEPELSGLSIPRDMRGRPHPDEGEQANQPRRGLAGTLIVVTAIVLFAGVIWYAYSQGRRAGSDSVAPLLRADPGPTKVRPDQPGGMDVPHQDKLVYERLQLGQSGEKVERLLPPPESPLERPKAPDPVLRTEEEGPASAAVTESPEEAARPAPPPRLLVPPPVAAGPTGQTATAPTAAAPAANRNGTTSATVAVPPPAAAPGPAVSGAVAPGAVQAAQSRLSTAAPPAAQTVPPPVASGAEPAALTAKPAATGGVRLQVAAVDSEGKAAAEWARLQRRFPGELGGLGYRTQRVDLGAKGVLFRIQAGPVDDARAAKICSVLKAQNAGCILVRN